MSDRPYAEHSQDRLDGDGLSVFLFDATATFHQGARGAALGYANLNKPVSAGVPGACVGVGIDEKGQFSNTELVGTSSTSHPTMPNSLVLRGPAVRTNPTGKYAYRDATKVTAGIAAGRKTPARVRVDFTLTSPKAPGSGKVTVRHNPQDPKPKWIDDTFTGLPSHVRLGFSATTNERGSTYASRNVCVGLPPLTVDSQQTGAGAKSYKVTLTAAEDCPLREWLLRFTVPPNLTVVDDVVYEVGSAPPATAEIVRDGTLGSAEIRFTRVSAPVPPKTKVEFTLTLGGTGTPPAKLDNLTARQIDWPPRASTPGPGQPPGSRNHGPTPRHDVGRIVKTGEP
ncbi:hypothetical protein ACFRCG_33610 [Embleya sp. NPDC056575]|uniref:hypothetical protein n=1 Tax=unclassified Embleya TaxID=2699296 RepID=UPI003676501E